MGAIYLVRHGQAAFATHHYDRLTRIGYTQARQQPTAARFVAAQCGRSIRASSEFTCRRSNTISEPLPETSKS